MQSISEDDCKEWFQSDDVQKYIRAIHNGETMALRMNHTDEHAGERSIKHGSSPTNSVRETLCSCIHKTEYFLNRGLSHGGQG